ncbi:MAG: HAD family hydrolase [bacterium]|nr:HAD family hydrolase [bacterium]
MNKAFFLDRDGVIIEEKSYICQLSQSEIFPFTCDAIKRMNAAGYKVIGITNQSAIARGICTVEQVETIHEEITRILAENGAVIDKFYYSPFHVDGVVPQFSKKSDRRKPAPGMLLQAAKDFNIDLSQSYMVGDSEVDILAGKNAGCKTILVRTGKGPQTLEALKKKNILPDIITDNILTAIKD